MYKKKGSFDLGNGYIITCFTFEIKDPIDGFTEVLFTDPKTGLVSSRTFESENVLTLEQFKGSVEL